jgi:hypothetical protein
VTKVTSEVVRNSTSGTGHPLPFSTTSIRQGARACAIPPAGRNRRAPASKGMDAIFNFIDCGLSKNGNLMRTQKSRLDPGWAEGGDFAEPKG